MHTCCEALTVVNTVLAYSPLYLQCGVKNGSLSLKLTSQHGSLETSHQHFLYQKLQRQIKNNLIYAAKCDTC